jgi:hypothetical protein
VFPLQRPIGGCCLRKKVDLCCGKNSDSASKLCGQSAELSIFNVVVHILTTKLYGINFAVTTLCVVLIPFSTEVVISALRVLNWKLWITKQKTKNCRTLCIVKFTI